MKGVKEHEPVRRLALTRTAQPRTDNGLFLADHSSVLLLVRRLWRGTNAALDVLRQALTIAYVSILWMIGAPPRVIKNNIISGFTWR